jgi:6,7-dimethyl-8-ribityllumazine synthase
MSEAEVEVVEEEEAAPPEEQPPEVEAAEPAAPGEHAPGDFVVPDGVLALQGEPRGERRTVAVAIARFNAEITNALLETALEALAEAGVARDAVTVVPVPGAFELPLTAMALAKTRRYSCIVALGCVIRGETPHFEYVAGEAASGLQLAAIETGVPVSFGVLTTETMEQAQERVPRAAEAARTALEMADLFSQLRAAAAGAVGR